MEHFRLRKYRGPEVWARVREAYVAGEPGAQVAARFDVSLANLRKRASREGWTRNQAARASDPLILATQPAILGEPEASDLAPVDPETARQSAIHRAGALLAAGRGAEAIVLLKAADAFSRLIGDGASGDEAVEIERFDYEALQTNAFQMAIQNAEAMLGDTGYGITSAFGHAAYHWRAANLGPEIARHDFEQGVKGGWASSYWEADGTLKPLDLEPKPRW
ncbi:hypothetical protein [Brevundimonas sp.]